MKALFPQAMGGKGSGRFDRDPERRKLAEDLKRLGFGVPQKQIDKAKVTGGRILRKAAKARRKRGK